MTGRIRELDIFLRVAEATSFSATARSLNVDPSTVSKTIQRLEARLGVRLFHRNSRVLRLTQEGESFMAGAQRVLRTLEETELSMGRATQEASGVVRLHSTPAFASTRLAPLMPDFIARYPRLRMEFILVPIPPDLFEQQIDISIQSGHIADSSWVARRIASTRWLLCAAPAYLARAGEPQEPEDLIEHRCLNFMPGSYRSQWPLPGQETPLEPQGSFAANNGDMLCALARAGLGIARLADYHAQADLDSGALVPVLDSAEHRSPIEPLYAVYPSKRHLSARVRATLEFLGEHLSEPLLP
ncbi:MAG: LysR substrate-binding domain-containing protein [Pigmentiphaga sp.]